MALDELGRKLMVSSPLPKSSLRQSHPKGNEEDTASIEYHVLTNFVSFFLANFKRGDSFTTDGLRKVRTER